MGDIDAVEELAKSLGHLSKAKELANRDHNQREIENLEERTYDVIDGLISEISSHTDST